MSTIKAKPINKPQGITLNKTIHTLYILNLNTLDDGNLEAIALTLLPDNISERYNQRIISESLYGTYSPQYFYTGGENKSISFRITVIEDELIPGETVYDLRDKLKRMSQPRYIDNVMKEPLIYFELGDQFIGKGYLTTGFTFRGPYAQPRGQKGARYTVADIEFQITLIEEYENLSHDLTIQDTLYDINRQLAESLDTIGLDIDTIRDLLEGAPDDGLELMKDFAFQKMNSVTDTIIGRNPGKTSEILGSRKANFGKGTIDGYWLDYAAIIGSNTLTVDSKIKNLNILKKNMHDFIVQAMGYLEFGMREHIDALNGLIDKQIQLYSYMGGAAT